MHHRTGRKEEIEAWIKEDSIESYRKGLIESGIASEERLDEIVEDTAGLITHILELSVDDSISPHLDLANDPDLIGKMMFSNGSVGQHGTRRA